MIDVSGTILFWCKSPVFKKQFNEVVMEKKRAQVEIAYWLWSSVETVY